MKTFRLRKFSNNGCPNSFCFLSLSLSAKVIGFNIDINAFWLFLYRYNYSHWFPLNALVRNKTQLTPDDVCAMPYRHFDSTLNSVSCFRDFHGTLYPILQWCFNFNNRAAKINMALNNL